MTLDIGKTIRESLLMAVRDRLAPYRTFKAKKTNGSVMKGGFTVSEPKPPEPKPETVHLSVMHYDRDGGFLHVCLSVNRSTRIAYSDRAIDEKVCSLAEKVAQGKVKIIIED